MFKSVVHPVGEVSVVRARGNWTHPARKLGAGNACMQLTFPFSYSLQICSVAPATPTNPLTAKAQRFLKGMDVSQDARPKKIPDSVKLATKEKKWNAETIILKDFP